MCFKGVFIFKLLKREKECVKQKYILINFFSSKFLFKIISDSIRHLRETGLCISKLLFSQRNLPIAKSAILLFYSTKIPQNCDENESKMIKIGLKSFFFFLDKPFKGKK